MENDRFFQTKLRVPIEAIFKNVHASERIPYIEYFGGMKQEPMVRLWYSELAQNGEKIPALSQKCLLDIVKRKLLTRPHIVLYVLGVDSISLQDANVQDFIQVIVEQSGQIQLRGTLSNPLPYDTFETWLKERTQPVFDMLNDYLFQKYVPSRIYKYIPKCKFIIMLRNPVERAFSPLPTPNVRTYAPDLEFLIHSATAIGPNFLPSLGPNFAVKSLSVAKETGTKAGPFSAVPIMTAGVP